MIVPMQKVTLLCLEKDQEHTLRTLQDVGVLHLHHVRAPESPELEKAHNRLEHLQGALELLGDAGHHGSPDGREAADVADDIWSLHRRRHEVDQELERLETLRRRYLPFGRVDPESIRPLADRGIQVRLFRQSADLPLPEVSDGIVDVCRDDGKQVWFTVIERGPASDIEAEEIPLPDRSTGAMTAEIDRLRADRQGIARDLAELRREKPTLLAERDRQRDLVQFLEAREGMGGREQLTYLQGYCPRDKVEALRTEAAHNGWGLLLQEPAPDEKVPTLLRNPSWVKPIKPVFDFINVVPGYREVDISAVFLVFFSLFFAMIVGDAGYGALYLVGTLLLWKKMPGRMAALMLIMSVATMVWGLLTANIFGVERWTDIREVIQVEWLMDESNIMLLCFLIGAVQLTIAHAWNAIRVINSTRALAQLGWICTTWGMFYLARSIVLGYPMPGFVMPLFGVGAALIVIFMTPLKRLKADWINHIMLPLTLVNNFVDVVSYVRLFAVGMATYAVASAFNQMAAGAAGGVAGTIGAVLIIFFGHLLNILLATMGVMVHGIRLNTLEFSSHLGMEWTGVRYTPFRRRRQDEAPAAGEAQ